MTEENFDSMSSDKFRNYSRTSLIRTPKGQSKVSVLGSCPFYRGHHDDVTFKTPLTCGKAVNRGGEIGHGDPM